MKEESNYVFLDDTASVTVGSVLKYLSFLLHEKHAPLLNVALHFSFFALATACFMRF